MFESCENPISLSQFPTELLIYIFTFLSAKNLIACRRVCKRWREVVDNIVCDDNLWRKHCETDFPTVYKDARKKSKCPLWFDLYRSLTLWGRLSDATESRDEFSHSPSLAGTIYNVSLLENGVAAVHKLSSIDYYDIFDLEPSIRKSLRGEYAKFVEYKDILVALSTELYLRILKKWTPYDSDPEGLIHVIFGDDETAFHRIRYFQMFGSNLYFVNMDDEIFYCDLDKTIYPVTLPRNLSALPMISMSLCDGLLHTITADGLVYKYENNVYERLFNLDVGRDNLIHFLWQYQFIDMLDWRIFYFWVANLHISLPEGPLRNIALMKTYGDVFLVGTNNGVVLIYYKPYTNGQLDLINNSPLNVYHFAEREDIPVLSLYPIISFDILEIEGGHKVLVGMPKKVIVLTFQHNFEILKSKAVVPYAQAGPVVLKE